MSNSHQTTHFPSGLQYNDTKNILNITFNRNNKNDIAPRILEYVHKAIRVSIDIQFPHPSTVSETGRIIIRKRIEDILGAINKEQFPNGAKNSIRFVDVSITLSTFDLDQLLCCTTFKNLNPEWNLRYRVGTGGWVDEFDCKWNSDLRKQFIQHASDLCHVTAGAAEATG
ncbi:uncharacterized protein EAE98_002437 [Botrytis deweyae]|uniref:Uncharacterized protein n=2 Tax=Botrytis TaxID=33196 RepID=A0A4Z1I895_9HELO|nr:uncharacterized protein EAE98_002437 [Botrytis deweyae]KAF7931253.1 hypothetical protein EAE99_003724 [Botrytis elliptica]KAF7936218.1 hypothetical protein EAE98_002437 [Botrytis deweyae]TGO56924.1 hypothetical protein BELL_1372g00030 [Botrytis elliptica]